MYVFNKQHPSSLQNIVFVARNGTTPIDFGDHTSVTSTTGVVLDVSGMRWAPHRLNLSRELVLTDDRAPVEYLAIKQF
jgi:hypothetical protein